MDNLFGGAVVDTPPPSTVGAQIKSEEKPDLLSSLPSLTSKSKMDDGHDLNEDDPDVFEAHKVKAHSPEVKVTAPSLDLGGEEFKEVIVKAAAVTSDEKVDKEKESEKCEVLKPSISVSSDVSDKVDSRGSSTSDMDMDFSILELPGTAHLNFDMSIHKRTLSKKGSISRRKRPTRAAIHTSRLASDDDSMFLDSTEPRLPRSPLADDPEPEEVKAERPRSPPAKKMTGAVKIPGLLEGLLGSKRFNKSESKAPAEKEQKSSPIPPPTTEKKPAIPTPSPKPRPGVALPRVLPAIPTRKPTTNQTSATDKSSPSKEKEDLPKPVLPFSRASLKSVKRSSESPDKASKSSSETDTKTTANSSETSEAPFSVSLKKPIARSSVSPEKTDKPFSIKLKPSTKPSENKDKDKSSLDESSEKPEKPFSIRLKPATKPSENKGIEKDSDDKNKKQFNVTLKPTSKSFKLPEKEEKPYNISLKASSNLSKSSEKQSKSGSDTFSDLTTAPPSSKASTDVKSSPAVPTVRSRVLPAIPVSAAVTQGLHSRPEVVKRKPPTIMKKPSLKPRSDKPDLDSKLVSDVTDAADADKLSLKPRTDSQVIADNQLSVCAIDKDERDFAVDSSDENKASEIASSGASEFHESKELRGVSTPTISTVDKSTTKGRIETFSENLESKSISIPELEKSAEKQEAVDNVCAKSQEAVDNRLSQDVTAPSVDIDNLEESESATEVSSATSTSAQVCDSVFDSYKTSVEKDSLLSEGEEEDISFIDDSETLPGVVGKDSKSQTQSATLYTSSSMQSSLPKPDLIESLENVPREAGVFDLKKEKDVSTELDKAEVLEGTQNETIEEKKTLESTPTKAASKLEEVKTTLNKADKKASPNAGDDKTTPKTKEKELDTADNSSVSKISSARALFSGCSPASIIKPKPTVKPSLTAKPTASSLSKPTNVSKPNTSTPPNPTDSQPCVPRKSSISSVKAPSGGVELASSNSQSGSTSSSMGRRDSITGSAYNPIGFRSALGSSDSSDLEPRSRGSSTSSDVFESKRRRESVTSVGDAPTKTPDLMLAGGRQAKVCRDKEESGMKNGSTLSEKPEPNKPSWLQEARKNSLNRIGRQTDLEDKTSKEVADETNQIIKEKGNNVAPPKTSAVRSEVAVSTRSKPATEDNKSVSSPWGVRLRRVDSSRPKSVAEPAGDENSNPGMTWRQQMSQKRQSYVPPKDIEKPKSEDSTPEWAKASLQRRQRLLDSGVIKSDGK